ncbi:MAG: hypothetical protein KAI99_10700 [Cyclobacteriaceae bacterium]|nr:hypothetical protein [Cyclobacteriaceae bacterium]
MKRVKSILIVSALWLGSNQLYAQDAPATPTTTLASGLGLYVFPAKDQDQKTQDADEMACYKWAKEQTGVDPINPPEIQAEEVDRSVDGTAVRGAARGAAAGAAIGAIAGDAGQGAAIGAVAGGLRGRRAKVVGDEMEQQANNQAAAAQTQEMMDNFNKAFSACLEGKGYTVK